MWRRYIAVVLLAVSACVASAADYYEVLGVARNADEQVRFAYILPCACIPNVCVGASRCHTYFRVRAYPMSVWGRVDVASGNLCR